MSETRIDGYAAGVLNIASGEGDVSSVVDELFSVAGSFEESSELRDALTDPRIPVERRAAIVQDLLGERSSPLVAALVEFIVSAGRARDLSAIATRVAELAAAEEDRAVAEVRTPIDLDEATIRRLEGALTTATGRRVEVKAIVDPSVLGGLVARVGDTVIDGSLRRRLESLRTSLVEG